MRYFALKFSLAGGNRAKARKFISDSLKAIKSIVYGFFPIYDATFLKDYYNMTRRLLRNWFGKPAHETVEVRKPEAQSSAPARHWIEKRREPRVSANELARIHSLEYRSDAMSCRILETSPSGLKISADWELSPGTIIQLFTARSIIMAEVRHCRRADDSFSIGLAIDNVIELPRFARNKNNSSLATHSLSEL